jgi:myo-inositol-1(or 4)-monophosphatase
VSNSPLINVMSAAALKAGKGLLRDFSEVDQLQISRKGTANFVTSADLRTEKLLRRELEKARPAFGFLLEEGGEIPGKEAGFRWIIDPLDGTTNFIHAIPYFCVSIALEKREVNGNTNIVAGVIYDPIHNDLFTAEQYKGAFLNNRRITVSARETLEDAMLVTGNPKAPAKTDQQAMARFNAISDCGATIRYFGATALDLANLAAGRIDACWYQMFHPWDVAAGILLVTEAGGTAIDLSGQPANCYSKNLLASNQKLSPNLNGLLARAA